MNYYVGNGVYDFLINHQKSRNFFGLVAIYGYWYMVMNRMSQRFLRSHPNSSRKMRDSIWNTSDKKYGCAGKFCPV